MPRRGFLVDQAGMILDMVDRLKYGESTAFSTNRTVDDPTDNVLDSQCLRRRSRSLLSPAAVLLRSSLPSGTDSGLNIPKWVSSCPLITNPDRSLIITHAICPDHRRSHQRHRRLSILYPLPHPLQRTAHLPSHQAGRHARRPDGPCESDYAGGEGGIQCEGGL